MSALKWFEIRFGDGTWTRMHEYSMETALYVIETEKKLPIISIEEVADGAGTKLA